MCGIFGFSELTETTKRMAPHLAHEMENRGKDSWGATDGQTIIRELGHISRSFYIPDEWTRGIFHTRLASCGAVTKDNAHPFSFPLRGNEWLIGIHNGVLYNHDELNRTHNRDFAVDSMHIFAHLADDKDLSDISGSAALAWYEPYGDGTQTLHLCRINSEALYVAELKTGEWAFASTRFALEIAARFARVETKKLFLLPENNVHVFVADENGKLALYKITDRKYEFRSLTRNHSHNWGRGRMITAPGHYRWDDFYDGEADEYDERGLPTSHDTSYLTPRSICPVCRQRNDMDYSVCFQCLENFITQKCSDLWETYDDFLEEAYGDAVEEAAGAAQGAD